MRQEMHQLRSDAIPRVGVLPYRTPRARHKLRAKLNRGFALGLLIGPLVICMSVLAAAFSVVALGGLPFFAPVTFFGCFVLFHGLLGRVEQSGQWRGAVLGMWSSILGLGLLMLVWGILFIYAGAMGWPWPAVELF